MAAAAVAETPFGHAIPPFPDHSITVHMPKWSTILQFIDNAQEVLSKVKSIYPRFGPFGRVKELVGKIASKQLQPGQACLLFASRDSAEACREFMLSENRKDNKCEPVETSIRIFDFHVRLWAVCFPAPKMPAAIPYWQDQGTGISSRMAVDCLVLYDSLKEVPHSTHSSDSDLSMDHEAFCTIRLRIAGLLNRASITNRSTEVQPSDVFLYPTGMAAIYRLHHYLQRSSSPPGSTVLFGFAFHSTPHVYQEYSTKFKWFGKGDEQDLSALETFCKDEVTAGSHVQAVWLEFPSNPNIRSADLQHLRALADKFGFYLIVDDTVASFCNVDLLDVADAVVTSLTKSFSGYADVMGGSIVLNPNSEYHGQLIDMCNRNFVNEFYAGDAEALEVNSRDYLQRSRRLNDNALAIVEYLHSCVQDESSAVSAVNYPSVGPGLEHYAAVMRSATLDFEAGYGCLFSIELESIESVVAFYDALSVHNGPHLSANLTLALPYVKALHSKDAKEMSWVEECGMNERMIRISVGLEQTEQLVQTFKTAVEAADVVKRKDPLDKLVNPLNGVEHLSAV